MTDLSRESLITLCERAIVQETQWCNRDSASAQRQVGECWALLRAGCEFRVHGPDENLGSDERTIWLTIRFDGFRSFDEGTEKESDTFYLPTSAVITTADWY